MNIQSFLHADTDTFTHLLLDESTQQCAIIDPVLDFDNSSGNISNQSADEVIAIIKQNGWKLTYLIETHAHADHLSAAAYIKSKLGGQTVIGKDITKVQKVFKQIYNFDTSFKTDANQFDILTVEGTQLSLGDTKIIAMHLPGHTPADMAYMVTTDKADDDAMAVFIGDTIFAPDVGTARCDFPGGDAATLYQSIQRLLSLPEDTLLYLCHDYPKNNRKHTAFVSVKEQKQHNIHVKDGISQIDFVTMRENRDATLSMPRLIIPSIQVNIHAGELPKQEDNGIRYLKVPLNAL